MREGITKPRVSSIAAIGKNRELGIKGQLLCHIPEDLKHFKELTMGKPIIMGSKTFESIGKALPGRLNIVLSSRDDYEAKGCRVVHSIQEAMSLASEHESDEVFIIGGGSVYKQVLDEDIVDRLYLTHIDEEFPEADVLFPEYLDFQKVIEERQGAGETFDYKFVTLERNEDSQD